MLSPAQRVGFIVLSSLIDMSSQLHAEQQIIRNSVFINTIFLHQFCIASASLTHSSDGGILKVHSNIIFMSHVLFVIIYQ